MMCSTTGTSRTSFDVIIVGAGVVGSALAFSLSKSGRSVALLERDMSEPDRIVGELLQPGGVRALKLLGLEACLEGIDAVPVQGYQVFYGPRSVPIPYPQEAVAEQGRGVQSFSGKVEGRSFHHGRFVKALRQRAVAAERVTTFEATVRDLIEDKQGTVTGVSATRKVGQAEEEVVLRAPLTIVADGCFSKFRRTHGSTIAPIVRSNFVALELKDAPLPSPQHGHVVLGPAGPTLLYQISTHDTRILIDVQGAKLPSQAKGELQAHIRERVIPQLPEQLRPCVSKQLESGQRLRSMPNSFLPPSMQGQNKQRKGVVLVGDAMNMRHPLTGGGMSVGLWDVVHLTTSLGGTDWTPIPRDATSGEAKDLTKWDELKPALRAWHWRRKGLASVINILAQALYSLFGADDDNLEVLREGCFAYFELGGECVGGPVRLLSGLAPEPLLLVYHFFRVALYSIYILFATPRPSASAGGALVKPGVLQWPGLAYRSVCVFWTACVVLLPVVFTEMRSNVPSFNETASAMGHAASSAGTRGKSGKAFGSAFPTFWLLLAAGAATWFYASPLNELTFPGALAGST